MNEYTVILIAGIGVLSMLCQVVAWWLKLSAILFLPLAGLITGLKKADHADSGKSCILVE